MVNNLLLRRIVAGQYVTYGNDKGRTKVRYGPIYELAVAQELLKTYGLHVVNENTEEDMGQDFIPALTPDELKDIILALRENDHYDDSEICTTTNGQRVDADGYTVYWNRRTRTEAKARAGQKLYVKFGFRENLNKCLVVSIHPAEH